LARSGNRQTCAYDPFIAPGEHYIIFLCIRSDRPVTISPGSSPVKTAMVDVKGPEGKTLMRKTFGKETGIKPANRSKGNCFTDLTVEHQKNMHRRKIQSINL